LRSGGIFGDIYIMIAACQIAIYMLIRMFLGVVPTASTVTVPTRWLGVTVRY
jgi:hypothetical protein